MPGLWQILVAVGLFAATRILPRTINIVAAWYFLAGVTVLIVSAQSQSLMPWAMALPFGVGQVLMAVFLKAHTRGVAMSSKNNDAPFAYDGLDRVIHEKARLGHHDVSNRQPQGLAFGDLKRLCGLTDGNLSRHIQVLQEAELVTVQRATRQPTTYDL